jgi:hypothetical protein
MTDERYNALMEDKGAELFEEEIEQGYHRCYSWDGLLIAPHMGEWLCCECFEDGKKREYTGPLMNGDVGDIPF